MSDRNRTKKQKPAVDDGLQMVITLKPEAWLDPAKPKASAEPVLRDLLKRVEKKTGIKPARVELFKNIGALSISASRNFIEELARAPEVLSSRPNVQEQSMKIEPVRKRIVEFGPRRKK